MSNQTPDPLTDTVSRIIRDAKAAATQEAAQAARVHAMQEADRRRKEMHEEEAARVRAIAWPIIYKTGMELHAGGVNAVPKSDPDTTTEHRLPHLGTIAFTPPPNHQAPSVILAARVHVKGDAEAGFSAATTIVALVCRDTRQSGARLVITEVGKSDSITAAEIQRLLAVALDHATGKKVSE